MKFLIIGDLHGNRPKIHFKEFDAIIAPGDFCSDALRTVMFQALQLRLKDPKSKVMWWDLISKRKAIAMIQKSLVDGRKILTYLNTLGVPVYVLPGNWDWTKDPESKFPFLRQDHWKFLIKGLNNIHNLHLRSLDIGKYQLIGHGVTSGPEYPQHQEDLARFTKSQLTQKKKRYTLLYNQVNRLFKKATKPVIFLTHNVPFNTPIDTILDVRSPRYGLHFGSLLAREIIDKHQPLVCVGAHMHEHFTSHQMEKTVAINAGFGSNVNVWLDVEGNKIKHLEFKRR